MKLVITFNAALLLASVVAQQARATEPGSDLFAPPGATSVESHLVNGRAQIHFDYSQRYPAQDLIADLNNELLSSGWTPRHESYLNPGQPTSHVRGWSRFEDASGDETYIVHQWWGEWGDSSGAVITYVLRYSYPAAGDPDLQNLSGFGIFTPREEVQAWELLQPHFEAEAEYERRVADRANRQLADTIRAQSLQTGSITLRAVKAIQSVPKEGADSDEWREEIEFDETTPPLTLDVAAASVVEGGVQVVFTEDAAVLARKFSKEQSGKRIAVFVGDELVWTPYLEGEIGDIAVIDGNFDPQEASVLVGRIMVQQGLNVR